MQVFVLIYGCIQYADRVRFTIENYRRTDYSSTSTIIAYSISLVKYFSDCARFNCLSGTVIKRMRRRNCAVICIRGGHIGV